MKIFDSFIFYNEIDLLNYRLNILDKYIDKFILVESKYTFSGKPKKLFYLENRHLFENFNSKIIHIVLEDAPFKYPNVNYKKNQQWSNEYFQRIKIIDGINKINNINDDDIILTSDVDEIPNPNILKKIHDNLLDYDRENLNKLALDMYYYNLNLRLGEGQNWHGIKLFNYKTLKNLNLTFQQIRVWEHTNHVPIIPSGGWHLSYFGNVDFIINKIKSYSHQEFNNNNLINDELQNKIKNGINIIGGMDLIYVKIDENHNLPKDYDIYLNKYYSL